MTAVDDAVRRVVDAAEKQAGGFAALLSGLSRTGIAEAVQAIASELGRPLYRMDLSRVVGKFVGDTENNLRRVFADAASTGAVLVFDEADALFTARPGVNDSHDRYTNLEVGFLLDRIDAYNGIVILTSNLKGNVDSAFQRRLRLVVEFN